jgi:hypothetical protein
MPLSRDEILAHSDLAYEDVNVPEWGGVVVVQAMTGAERDRFESAHVAAKAKDARARLAVYTVRDQAGLPLFTEADIPALSAKSAAPLDRIFEVAARLSRITKEDVDKIEGN